ncbi:bifunctional metallophosphatase/5'-nucleotidase [Collinsella tanakaei]|uniref:Bifunctional metallophosphatase/5'-nucleotidase n=1 Tax=Collinsella tanakaei TaxID=626935 RepID=A0A3E4QZC6_9ACTN|nr:5'-nucleotidase C-terminal domain-containing protein [Collinsella tanakaei]RGL12174.1 bifunctional metallophosphatase/5'-nucleotidase [Collinsella tanakaei]
MSKPIVRRTLFSLGAAALIAGAVTAAPAGAYAAGVAGADGASKDGAVSIVFTNDVHCAIDQQVDKDGNVTGIGYAGVAAYANAQKSLYGAGNVTLVDAGDAIQGGPVGTLTKGAALVQIMNAVGYDYAIPGNHEFDYGMDQFNALVKQADAMYLSCNFTKLNADGSKASVFAPFAIETYKDADVAADDADGVLKVAYVGISTPETLTKSSPANFQDAAGNYIYGFCQDETGEALYAAVQSAVDEARAQGADYVVAVGHLGIEGTTSRWTSEAVIKHTAGIDALIDGHSHEAYDKTVGSEVAAGAIQTLANSDGDKVVLVQTGTKLANVGNLVIDADEADGQDVIAQLVPASECKDEDAAVKKVVDQVNGELADVLNKVVGKTDVALTIVDADGVRQVRHHETNMGDLVADAYRAAVGADIALANGGGVRASIAAGDITNNDLLSVQPYGNELCLIEATGQEILDALEMGASNAPEEFGGFLQVSGLSYKIDASIPSSVKTDENGNFVSVDGERRVFDVKVGDQAIDATKTYKVASHGYMLLEGGDGLTMFKDNKVLQENVILDNQALINYITNDLKGVVGERYANATGEGRITYATKPGTDFKDVAATDWFAGVVGQAVDAELMKGYSDDSGASTGFFGPYDNMTRAQVVTVLYRISGDATPGEKPGANKTPFTDVEDGAYYINALNWAYENGLTSGYTKANGEMANLFGPHDTVTREQLVTLVWRAAGAPVATSDDAYRSCKDAGKESVFAVDALKWAASKGILTGSVEADGSYLKPTASTLRCEGAKVFVLAKDLIKDGVK